MFFIIGIWLLQSVLTLIAFCNKASNFSEFFSIFKDRPQTSIHALMQLPTADRKINMYKC